jgi:hypothetical protein
MLENHDSKKGSLNQKIICLIKKRDFDILIYFNLMMIIYDF